VYKNRFQSTEEEKEKLKDKNIRDRGASMKKQQ